MKIVISHGNKKREINGSFSICGSLADLSLLRDELNRALGTPDKPTFLLRLGRHHSESPEGAGQYAAGTVGMNRSIETMNAPLGDLREKVLAVYPNIWLNTQ